MVYWILEDDLALIIMKDGKCVDVSVKERQKTLARADAITEMMIAALNNDEACKEGLWVWHVKAKMLAIEGFEV